LASLQILQLNTWVALDLTNYGQQEGQHPLTGQRAANFKLLANQ